MQGSGEDGGRDEGVPVPTGPEEGLYGDICSWREQLARNIARNNIGMQSSRIGLAVNRVIFTLLALAIAEDRGILVSGTLRALAEGGAARGAVVLTPFGDPWTGTGEEPRAGDTAPEVDLELIHTIAGRLSSPDRPYDLATIPLETVAATLDRYLARTIRRSAAHQAVVVDRSCAGTGRPDIPPALIEYAANHTLVAASSGRHPEDSLPLRVIDPACGAGRMLVCGFYFLQSRDAEPADLLRYTIHGLDPDPHAVAAARILLALAACEGRNAPAAPGDFFAAFRENLGILTDTVRCGNALVDPTIADDESWAFCPARERHEIRPFAWQDNFSEILIPGGFDAVISSPLEHPVPAREWLRQYFQCHYEVYDPEAGLSAYMIEKSLAVLRPLGVVGIITGRRWLNARSGAPLRRLVLSRQPEEIVTAGDDACYLLLGNARPVRPFIIRNAGPAPASADAIRIIPGFPVDGRDLSDGGWKLRDTRKEQLMEKIRRGTTPLGTYVLGEIQEEVGPGPDPAFVIDIATRDELVRNDPRCRPLIRQYVCGEDITRYGPAFSARYLIARPSGWTSRHAAATGNSWRWLKKRHPGIARYLREHEADLKDREEPGACWWELPAPLSGWEGQDRILFSPGTGRLCFMRAGSCTVPGPGTDVIPTGSRYLLGLLSSRLAGFVFSCCAEKAGTQGKELLPELVSRFPVATPDFDDPSDAARHGRMEALVAEREALHRGLDPARPDRERQAIAREIESVEKQIDSLVYGIYGLSVDEIAVLESLSPSDDVPL